MAEFRIAHGEKMKAHNIQNSKFKNSGILFEALIRQVSVDTMNGVSNSPSIQIIQKYFSPSTELGKEIQLYRAFFDIGKLTESRAVNFVDLVLDKRKKLDERKLLNEKYSLIREIKSAYPLKEFLSSKIPNYRLYSSIYKTFCTETASDDIKILNISDVALARFSLIEHLIVGEKKPEPQTEQLKDFVSQDANVRNVAQKIFVDKFNQKYSTLNDKQKILLREYISHAANPTMLIEYVKKEVPALQKEITLKAGKLTNQVLKIKLHEVSNQLQKLPSHKTIKDNHITAMLMAYQILEEI